MLSKEDYNKHLQQMYNLEKSMVSLYKELADEIKDEAMRNTVISIMKDESRHVGLVEEMKKFLNA
ncbi:MAG: ferritin-like domain-containing protein [Candidatus Omnitrophota bacterium]|nr:MAG: ferritin-like domain-containing protein [Candidatus Omnitrophota bacterium]